MKVVLSACVQDDIAERLQYSINRFGHGTTAKTFARVDNFFHKHLADYPYTGRRVGNGTIFESWISSTPFVVMYRIDDDAQVVTVLALFHHAQDRSDFSSTDE